MAKLINFTEQDVSYLEERLEGRFRDIFATKEELQQVKSDLMTILLKILKNTEDDRIDRTVLTHHVAEHEDRLQVVESKLNIVTS